MLTGDAVSEFVNHLNGGHRDGQTTQYELDRFGLATKTVDSTGAVQTAVRDRNGLATAATYDPDGAGGQAALSTYSVYDDQGNVILQIAADGTEQSWSYGVFGVVTRYVDVYGRVTVYELDARGNVEEQRLIVGEDDRDSDETDDVVTTNTYTLPGNTAGLPVGLLLSSTDPFGTVTTYEYDVRRFFDVGETLRNPNFGALVAINVAVGRPDEVRTEFVYGETKYLSGGGNRVDPNFGQLIQVVTAEGTAHEAIVRYSYDGLGRQTRSVSVVGDEDTELSTSFDDLVTEYAYDDAGRVIKSIQVIRSRDVSNALVTDNRMTEYKYDALGRIARVTSVDPDGSGPLTSATVDYVYDAVSGQVTDEIRNASVAAPRRTHYKYDALGRIEESVVVRGELDDAVNLETDDLRTIYEYDAVHRDRILRITNPDPDGAGALPAPVTEFAYDEFGRKTAEITVVGNRDGVGGNTETDDIVVQYQFDAFSQISAIVAQPGTPGELVQTNQYDALGRLHKQLDALGRGATLTYDNFDRVEEVEGPATGNSTPNSRTINVYDSRGRLETVREIVGDDDRDNPFESNDRVTHTTYDLLGRVESVRRQLGADDRTSLESNDDVTRFEYDAVGRVVAQFDGNNHQTRFTYDAAGNLVAQTRVVGDVDTAVNGHTDDVVTTFGYDRLNRRTTVTSTDPDGAGVRTSIVTVTTFDVFAQITAVTVGYGSALAATTTYVYDDLGRATDVYDATGRRTHYTYDNLGRVTAVARVAGQSDDATNNEQDDAVEQTVYDAAGRVFRKIDPEGRTVEYAYDAQGRVIEVRQIVAGRDAEGLPQDDIVTRSYYDAFGLSQGTITADGRTTHNEFDGAGRLVASTDTLGNRTTYKYDELGRLTSRFDPPASSGGAPVETRYDYNALDQLTAQTAAYGTISAQRTEFEYDAVGNRTVLRDAGGNETRWHFDELDRVTYERIYLDDASGDPASATGLLRTSDRTWTYDKLGLVMLYVDRNERSTTYGYDELGRRSAEAWYAAGVDPAASGSAAVRSYAYDYDAAGRVETLVDSAGPGYFFHYDAFGRLEQTDLAGLTAEQITLVQQYNKADQRTTLNAYLTAAHLTSEAFDIRNEYTYHADLGRLEEVTQTLPSSSSSGRQTLRVDFGYDASSRLTRLERSRSETSPSVWTVAITSDYAFDAQGRLVGLRHAYEQQTLENYAWTYDDRNRLATYASLAEGVTTYGYDDRDQLTSVDRIGTADDEAYSYDENGNRITSSSAALAGGSYTTGLNNRLLSDGTYTYRYDDEGNRIERREIATGATVEYVWDNRNRLSEVIEKNSAGVVQERAEYNYAYDNQRIAKRVYDATTTAVVDERYLYDGDQLLVTLDVGGGATTAYLAVGGAVYAQTSSGLNSFWLLADQLGSTRQVVDSTSGGLYASYRYDAYGNLAVLSGDATATTILYTGLFHDQETGGYYADHRYYDPLTGRWHSVDWIEDNLNNFYGYVGNSPTNFLDPDGLQQAAPSRYKEDVQYRFEQRVRSKKDPKITHSYWVQEYERPLDVDPRTANRVQLPRPKNNVEAKDQILKNIDGFKTNATIEIYEMLKQTPPKPASGRAYTDEDLIAVANTLSNAYIVAAQQFIVFHPGVKPELGKRGALFEALGLQHAANYPWCADWAEAVSKSMNAAKLFDANGNELISDLITIRDTQYNLSLATGRNTRDQHNFVSIAPFGHGIKFDKYDDRIRILDPWRTISPVVYKPVNGYYKYPTNEGFQNADAVYEQYKAAASAKAAASGS